ncbi:MAG TPA: glycosyltransferase [Pyrinomonadaceae bacterium]|jgi:GT2 family glycosyltransferase
MRPTASLKERLKRRTPLALKLLAKRALVGAVGAGLRVAARAVGLGRHVLHLAVKHGLDMDEAWPARADAVPSAALAEDLWGAQDFLLLMDARRAAARATDAPPVASIIIPVYNKAAYTFQALRALLREVDLSRHEIVVVNNASTDETARLLAHFGALLTVVNNEENRGFVDACNQGAGVARGRFLVFLNNDTAVRPGWLAGLVETVERDERVGAVGSLLLYPDGTIQEAGAIIWRDGAVHHYGWGRRADDRRCNFAREVDCCSGASLLVRRELFDRLGGFDARFAPAYYEDADLCMGVRALGHKVVFQPASRLVHYEGVTAGRDTAAGFKRFQTINREKFVAKWREVLAREHLPHDPAHVERAADRSRAPRVVVFDERVPTPDRDAGSARMLFILRTLARDYRVLFVALYRPEWPDYERRLWHEGIETAPATAAPRLLRAHDFHAAVASRPEVAAALLPAVRRLAPRARLVFDMVDAHHLRLEREHALTQDPQHAREAARYRKLEAKLARTCDMIWCASPEEARVMAAFAPATRVEVVPTIHEARPAGLPYDERRELLFIGSFVHRPNSDGVLYFLREVLPLVQAALPGVELDLIGDGPPPEVAAYAGAAVRVRGYVPDVEPFWQTRRVFVAPLRYGAGIKGKIGEALAHGLPVVTTTVGAEGMGLAHEQTVMLADAPAEFAAAVARLYTDAALWQRLADAGRAHVAAHFGPAAVARVITDSLRDSRPDGIG